MCIHKGNIQNNANEHETSNWKGNKEEDAEFIFCLETFMDSASDER